MNKIFFTILLSLLLTTLSFSQTCEYTITLPNCNFVNFDGGTYISTSQGRTYTLDCGTVVHEIFWPFIWSEQTNVVDCEVCHLPVEFISYEYKCSTNTLTWVTASEINNDVFIISVGDFVDSTFTPKNSFEVMGNGNSNEVLTYDYVFNTNINNSYIQLMQVDYDGTSTLLGYTYVSCDDKVRDIKITPNPNEGSARIIGDYENIVVYDMIGKEIHSQIINNKITGLSTGMYIVIIDGKYKIKLITK